MRQRKEAWVWLVSWALVVLVAGCAAGPETAAPCAGLVDPHRALEARGQIGPDLRIPVDTSPAPRPLRDYQVTQASAQVPAKSSVALEDDAGPALKEPDSALAVPSSATAKLRTLYRAAAERYAGIDSYIARLRRREQVNGRDKPEEILCVKFRKQPWSIYFKWLGKAASGREVIYVKGRYDDKINTLLAAGDMPLTPAGKRIALSPDNPLVRSSSRHSIHEAGIGVMISSFGALADATQKKDISQGTLRYLGLVKRPEFDKPCEGVEQEIRPGVEVLLPRGGRRLWLFDTESRFPVLLLTYDDTQHEVEYYCYDRFQFPVRLDDDDFNPDKLWAQKKPAPAKNGAPNSGR